MRGAVEITYNDGSQEYFEVDLADAAQPNFAERLRAFIAAPTVTLVLQDQVMVIPSTSIRHVSITRAEGPIDRASLGEIPGVLFGARRIHG